MSEAPPGPPSTRPSASRPSAPGGAARAAFALGAAPLVVQGLVGVAERVVRDWPPGGGAADLGAAALAAPSTIAFGVVAVVVIAARRAGERAPSRRGGRVLASAPPALVAALAAYGVVSATSRSSAAPAAALAAGVVGLLVALRAPSAFRGAPSLGRAGAALAASSTLVLLAHAYGFDAQPLARWVVWAAAVTLAAAAVAFAVPRPPRVITATLAVLLLGAAVAAGGARLSPERRSQVLRRPMAAAHLAAYARFAPSLGIRRTLLPVEAEGVTAGYRDVREIPGNGVDENRLGGDLTAPLEPPPRAAPTPCAPWDRVRNVVWISLDALRADVVHRADFPRRAPTLHRLRTEGVSFERFRTASARTDLSVLAQLKGDFGVTGFDDPERFALGRLRKHGLFVFVAGWFHAPTPFFDGADDRLFFEPGGSGGREAIDGLDASDYFERLEHYVAALAARPGGGRPFFVFVHFGDAHWPYARGASREPFERYLETLSVLDGHVARHLRLLEAHGVLDSTLVVINGDHGEEFGEHGGRFHATSLFEEVIRTPLVLHLPGATPRAVTQDVHALDIAPTLFDVLGLAPPSRLLGRTLQPALCGRPLEPRPSGGRTFHPSPLDVDAHAVGLRKSYVVVGSDKLVLDRGTGSVDVFDLVGDPGETTNVLGSDPQRDRALFAAMDAFLHAFDEPASFPRREAPVNGPPVPLDSAPEAEPSRVIVPLPLRGDAGVTARGFGAPEADGRSRRVLERAELSVERRLVPEGRRCRLVLRAGAPALEVSVGGEVVRPFPSRSSGYPLGPAALPESRPLAIELRGTGVVRDVTLVCERPPSSPPRVARGVLEVELFRWDPRVELHGLYDPEAGDEPFRWTDGHGSVVVRDLEFDGASTCRVEADVRGAEVEIRVNGAAAGTAAAPAPIPFDAVAGRREHEIELVSASFRPSERDGTSDTRSLGVQVRRVAFVCSR